MAKIVRVQRPEALRSLVERVQQQREALERLPAQAAGQVSLRQERPRVAELGQSRSRSRLRSLSTAE